MTERMEVQRTIAAQAADIFAVLCDPYGHVAIDATGTLQGADGEPAKSAGDSFVIHMDREALNDFPMGEYDVTVEIREFEKNRLIDWSGIDPEWRKANIFPVIPESAPRATLGILDRTVRRGYPRG